LQPPPFKSFSDRRNNPSLPSINLASTTSTKGAGEPQKVMASEVLVVDMNPGPGVDYTSLQDAVDTAGDGDVLLIKTGIYPSPVITAKSLSLIADVGASVTVLSNGGGYRFLGSGSTKRSVCHRRYSSRWIGSDVRTRSHRWGRLTTREQRRLGLD
ncbi:MAG: hypothetical protein ACI87A_001449, partial [Planctomycetota bacterium]